MDDKGEGSVSFSRRMAVFSWHALSPWIRAARGAGNHYMWVAGKDYVPWRQQNNRTFELVLDREKYNPGETAQIMIASPFQGEVYAWSRSNAGHIRKSKCCYYLPTAQSTTCHHGDMAPGVYISVLIIKGVDDTNPRPDFRMSIAKIK